MGLVVLKNSMFWLVLFQLMLDVIAHRNELSPVDECIQSAPRVFSKALSYSLCQNASSYAVASEAVECAHAVGRGALNPKLAVELCSINGNNAGKSGGICATFASKSLQSFDQIPPPMRLSLCIDSPSYNPHGPVDCFLAAGKFSRNHHPGNHQFEWLNDIKNRISLCNGASSKAPVSCVEALYTHKKSSNIIKKISTNKDKEQMKNLSINLCSKVITPSHGQCASSILNDLPTTILNNHHHKISSSSNVIDNDNNNDDDIDYYQLINQLCYHVSHNSSYSKGPYECLIDAPLGWSIKSKIELCSNAIDSGPSQCVKTVKGLTTHRFNTSHLLFLCKTPIDSTYQSHFSSSSSSNSQKALYLYYQTIEKEKGNDLIKKNDIKNTFDIMSKYKYLIPYAAQCVNHAPSQMKSSDKIELCLPSTLPDNQINGSLHSVPGPSLCAKKALSLHSYSDRAKLCQGAINNGPADCLTSTPYTMATSLKVQLCHLASSPEPGKCASQVRNHILSTTFTPQLNNNHNHDDDGNDEGEVSTVPEAPSQAAAAGMIGIDPLDTRKADMIAVELCYQTQTNGPSQCFAKAPRILDQSSSLSSSSIVMNGHDLRSSLCLDAENDLPAKCAAFAYNTTIQSYLIGGSGRQVQDILGSGVIVSLCHGVSINEMTLLKSSKEEEEENNKEEERNIQGEIDKKQDEIEVFGPISCAATFLKSQNNVIKDNYINSNKTEYISLILKLCTHVPNDGPAQCIAHLPNHRFTLQEKVDICFQNKLVIRNHQHKEQEYEEKQKEEVSDWLIPAQCAIESPMDVPNYKIVHTCNGATSKTPAYCLRTIKTTKSKLTIEDLNQCRKAISVPNEIHMNVYEERIGLGNATLMRSLSSTSTSTTNQQQLEQYNERDDTDKMLKHVQQHNNKDTAKDAVTDTEDVISRLRVETTLVDQFLQPVTLTNLETFQTSSLQPSSSLLTEQDEKDDDNGVDDINDNTVLDQSSNNVVIDMTAKSSGQELKHVRFDLSQSINTFYDNQNDNDNNDQTMNDKNNMNIHNNNNNNNNEEEEDSKNKTIIGYKIFSKVVSFALHGQVLNSIHLLYTSTFETSNPNMNHSSFYNLDKKMIVIQKEFYHFSKHFLFGISQGMKHDWFLENGQNFTSILNSFSLQTITTNLIPSSSKLTDSLHQNQEFDQKGDEVHHPVLRVGEVAGVILALPFRTGQGVGFSIRHQMNTRTSLPSPTSTSSTSTSTVISIDTAFPQEIDRENDKDKTTPSPPLPPSSDSSPSDSSPSYVGPYFDICLGLLFAFIIWGSLIKYIFNKLNTIKGGSEFGQGDFSHHDFNNKNNKNNQSNWRGRSHSLKERNDRAILHKQKTFESKLENAIEHDLSYGLIGTKGGVAKRRKKFILGTS